MSKKLIKPLVLFAVFVIAIVVSSILTNASNEDMTTSMAEATLPTITLHYNETPINKLHGYVRAMDASKMRGTLTPIGKERDLSVTIDSYGTEIEKISYEIRSLDGSRLMADGESSDFTIEGNRYGTSLHLKNILTEGEEYMLILSLAAEQRDIYYYTRLMQTQESATAECLSFVQEFHDYTFRDDAADFIPTYMDPATGDTTTLAYVDLGCTLKQITWADFDGSVMGDPVIRFWEINASYQVLTMTYVMTTIGDEGDIEFYNVEEYYRLRRAETRIYVLNFERTLHQIFRGENHFVSDAYNILLGIRDPEVEYQTTDAGSIICFVQEGELWCYHVSDHTLVQVFSFLSPEGIGERENWDGHKIRIIRMDEAGSVDFSVCGYMNRGEHEGEVGLGLYHYDGIAHTVEEEAFWPTTESEEILSAKTGQLVYENEQGITYLMLQGTVYVIDMDTLALKPLTEGLRDGSYAVSASNRFFAWVDAGEENSSDTIHLMDFRTGNKWDISDGEGTYLRPLGFLEEDFIYGAADRQSVAVNSAGNTDFPMDYIRILGMSDTGYELLKEYAKPNRYIEDIEVEKAAITVHLLSRENGQFSSAGIDSIMNKEAEKEERVMIKTIVTEEKETQIVLSQSATLSASKVKLITPKSVLNEQDRTLAIPTDSDGEQYYAYAKGDVLIATDSAAAAIQTANGANGVVIDSGQNYIWKRARGASVSPLTAEPSEADKNASPIAQCISAMLSAGGYHVSVSELLENAMTPREVLMNSLGEDGSIVDLSGCSVDETLYYISNGIPVFALTGANDAVLLVGYDSENVTYFDPKNNTKATKSFEEADAWFSNLGGVYFSYNKR